MKGGGAKFYDTRRPNENNNIGLEASKKRRNYKTT